MMGKVAKVYFKDNGLLYLLKDKEETEVEVVRCFPWSYPQGFFSLRDREDQEVYLVEELDQMDPESRNALISYMKRMDFVFEISGIVSIEEDVELRVYKVQTLQGERTFRTKLDDWPTILDDGRIIIEDLCGDLYRVTSFESLAEIDQKKLAPYVD